MEIQYNMPVSRIPAHTCLKEILQFTTQEGEIILKNNENLTDTFLIFK